MSDVPAPPPEPSTFEEAKAQLRLALAEVDRLRLLVETMPTRLCPWCGVSAWKETTTVGTLYCPRCDAISLVGHMKSRAIGGGGEEP